MLLINAAQIVCHPKACSIVLAKTEIGEQVLEGMIGIVVKKDAQGVGIVFENGEQIEFDTSKTFAHFDFFVAVTDRYAPMPQDEDVISGLSKHFDFGAIDAALYQKHCPEQAVSGKPIACH